MTEETETVSILRITEQDGTEMEDVVVREFQLTIILNNQELVTLLCSPTNLKYLALGFLASEGFIRAREEVKSIFLDDRRGVARVQSVASEGSPDTAGIFKRFITSGCGRGAAFYSIANAEDAAMVESKTEISASQAPRSSHSRWQKEAFP